MKHQKIFKWRDGTRTKVIVALDSTKVQAKWQVNVQISWPGKSTFKPTQITGATLDQIQETMLELWQKIKPNYIDEQISKAAKIIDNT